MQRALIATCVFLLLAATLWGQANILNNGGFETGLMCYNTSVWSYSLQDFRGDYRFRLSTDAHSGKYSLEITCPTVDSDCMKAAIVSDRIPTKPWQNYTLNLYTKCPAGRLAAVYIPDTHGGDTFEYVTCNGTWAPNQINFMADNTADFRFYVYNRDVEWLRIDDIVLTYTDGTVPPSAPLHPGRRNVSVTDRTFSVDGNPYLALGFFDVFYDDLPFAAALGANTVVGLQERMSGACFNTTKTSYLDRAYESKLNFVPHSVTTSRLMTPEIFPSVFSTFSPHLANIGWFMADEPDQADIPLWYVPAAALLAEYQAGKPYATLPVITNFQRAGWSALSDVQPYDGAADIWMAEPYGSNFDNVSHATAMFNQLSHHPVWLALDDVGQDIIVPKAYWAIVKGATGIVYFNWNNFIQDSAKLNAASQSFKELGQLTSAIFAAPADASIAAVPAGVGTLARSYNGSTYILAVNPVATTVSGDFSIPGLAAGTPIQVLFENRTITAKNGGFSDTFSGIARHVYVVSNTTTIPVTIASIPSAVAVSIDGTTSCTTPCTLNWIPSSTHSVAISPLFSTSSTSTRYAFASWSDGGAAAHTVTAPQAALNLTAQFTTQHQLSTSVSPVASGTITPAAGWYNAGTALSVTATPAPGYQFAGFAGTLSGATSPQTLTLSAPATVTASFTVLPPTAGWYAGYSSRRKISIKQDQIAGALTDFPMLVSLTGVTSANGNDILFTTSDGVTKLNHEIERFDPATGALVAWVRVPKLDPATATSVYLYSGSAGAAPQQNKTQVWDAGYRAVLHFADASDSTQFGNQAALNSGASIVAAGLAGSAVAVDGASGQAQLASNPSWNGSFSSLAVEFWMKPVQLKDYAATLAVGGWSSPFKIWTYANGSMIFQVNTASGYCAASQAVPLDGAFHHVAVTYDSALSALNAYVDGVPGQWPSRCTGKITLPAGALTLGRFENGSAVAAAFDELRVSADVPRSAAWIAASVNNQKAPASFYDVGAAESISGFTPPPQAVAVTLASLPAGIPLTVDGATCVAPCTVQWAPGSSHTLIAPALYSGSPAGVRYAFAAWSDSGAQTHTVAVGSSATTFTAAYDTQYLLTTSVNLVSAGTISAGGWYTAGTPVTVAATTNFGFRFAWFSGALTGSTPAQTLVMSAPATVTANFIVPPPASWLP